MIRSYVLKWRMSDGRSMAVWESDPNKLNAEGENQISIVVDGGPKIILFVINGALNDGGGTRQFGWGRLSPNLRDLNGREEARVAPEVTHLVVHSQALMVEEAVIQKLSVSENRRPCRQNEAGLTTSLVCA